MDYLSKCKATEGCKNFHDPFFPSCNKCLDIYVCEECDFLFPKNVPKSGCPSCNMFKNQVTIGLGKGDINPLFEAIKNGDLDCWGNKATLDYRSRFGEPALFILVRNTGNEEVIKKLLEEGANPNAMGMDCFPILHPLIGAGYFDLLISYGADPDIPYYEGVITVWEDARYRFKDNPEEVYKYKSIVKEIRNRNIKG